jgi:hypothetical protein
VPKADIPTTVAIHESSCDKGVGADRVEHALSSWGFYKLDKGLLTITSAAATDPYSRKEVIHQMEFRAARARAATRERRNGLEAAAPPTSAMKSRRLIDHPHGGSCSLSQQ